MTNKSSKARQIVQSWLTKFDKSLAEGDISSTIELFKHDCFWRDFVAFTWNIRTLEGHEEIKNMLSANLASIEPKGWLIDEEPTETDGITEAWLRFETATTRGRAILRIIDGKAWTLLTTAEELKGFEEPKGHRRPKGTTHGAYKRDKNWFEKKLEYEKNLGYSIQPYCLVIGGGQGGIALGARLKQLGVPTIIVEKNARAGDSWRNRYRSLVLHDPVWYDHLPYIPFPDTWPIFTPKDKLGDWLEMYTKVMELNYWGSTECIHASYDENNSEWHVDVLRDGTPVTLKPKQVVFATGAYGPPNIISLPGIETFSGQHFHSSSYKTGAAYEGKHCIIIGANSSAHDIAADLYEFGAKVTMLQRSPTTVIKSETLMDVAFNNLYSQNAVESGISTDKADLIFAATPLKIMPVFQKPLYDEMRRRDASFYKRLERVGFRVDFGEDESGLMMKAMRSGSGYYIDVGASDLIADGHIAIRSGVEIKNVKANSVELTDGTELGADVIVQATGYQSMNRMVAKIVSNEMADKVGKCWGLGSGFAKDPGPWEGEPRNMWKPTQQTGLWFHGGNLHLSRHFSQLLAIQIKARMECIPTPVFGMRTVHHKF